MLLTTLVNNAVSTRARQTLTPKNQRLKLHSRSNKQCTNKNATGPAQYPYTCSRSTCLPNREENPAISHAPRPNTCQGTKRPTHVKARFMLTTGHQTNGARTCQNPTLLNLLSGQAPGTIHATRSRLLLGPTRGNTTPLGHTVVHGGPPQ